MQKNAAVYRCVIDINDVKTGEHHWGTSNEWFGRTLQREVRRQAAVGSMRIRACDIPNCMLGVSENFAARTIVIPTFKCTRILRDIRANEVYAPGPRTVYHGKRFISSHVDGCIRELPHMCLHGF